MPDKIVNWLKVLDLREVAYPLLAAIALAVITLWAGGFRNLKKFFTQRRGASRYKKALRKACQSLIVVGRREGFSLDQVYVPLELATSDLDHPKTKPVGVPWDTQFSYVLVAGPGAGKSTYVKKAILDQLETHKPMPFLVRLREYDPQQTILGNLAEQLRAHKIPDPEEVVEKHLKAVGALCVLDGLDEVRPHLVRAVCDRINSFYHDVTEKSQGRLVVTCRKEAYRNLPLDIETINEVRPLTDEQMLRFAKKWPLPFPAGKSVETFMADLASTPQIFQLARSPLLLVGGLMQYTESNLGIPQERVQYLARIAQWLVGDWAVAQGHHPDPYRQLYPRVLSRLASQMHAEERSEYAADKAVKLIESWIPQYGVDSAKAKEVFSGLLTRTGILVRDLRHLVVFSQFGLQEYYASIGLLGSSKIESFAEIADKVWWREAILLAIAQQNEPTTYIEQLFQINELLAAESVAESPTPSLSLQERAIESCIRGIDHGTPTAVVATVSLLRRVRGVLEQRLVEEVEKRLSSSERAKEAGSILAVAGTASATTALARHPAIWETCLPSTGYLSSSLEKLLVMWIRDGDEFQSRHATDLLADRLSADRCSELTKMLSELPEAKASHLAVMLLKYKARPNPDGIYIMEPIELAAVEEIAACSARLPIPTNIQAIMGEENTYSRYSAYGRYMIPAIALRNSGIGSNPKRIGSTILNASSFINNSGPMTCWIGAAVALCGLATHLSWVAAVSATCLVFLGIANPSYCSVPLAMVIPRYRARDLVGVNNVIGAIPLVLLGASCFWAIGARFQPPHQEAFSGTLAVGFSCALTGFAMRFGRFYRRKLCVWPETASLWSATVLICLCSAAFFLRHWLASGSQVAFRAVGGFTLCVFILCMLLMQRDLRLAARFVEEDERRERANRSRG
jgi:hypothetical protein